ncbi:MAG TPA: ankyrin repeat domain-containing protein [Treponema sp.]|nr:ankyrin repeat domain-containing protein [Treponema sp.]
MNTCVLCSKNDEGMALDLLRLLRKLGVPSSAFSIGADWRTGPKCLDEALAPFTHFIVAFTGRSSSSSWLPFAAGYALGNGKPLLLFRPSREPQQDAWLASFPLFSSPEDLSAFLETENREWAALSIRRQARQELMELGVSFRGQAFADSVSEGNVHAVELFIRAGMPVDSRDLKGVPMLCLAARTGHRALLDLLLENGASPDIPAEDRGNTALMDAVAGGFLDIMEDLLAAGASLEHRSKDGQTALVIAVGKNDSGSAALLLAAGADPEAADKLGFSARKYAKLFHDPKMTALMETHPPK